MILYFLSVPQTVLLKNGEKAGNLDKLLKVTATDSDVFTFLSPDFVPFSLNFSAPPTLPDVTLYEYNGGYVVDVDEPRRVATDFYFKKSLGQNAFITLSQAFGVAITLVINGVALRLTDNFRPDTADAEIVPVFNERLVKLTLSNDKTTRLYLFGFDGKPFLKFKNDVSSYSFDGGFYTKTNLYDLKDSVLAVKWTTANGELTVDGFERTERSDRTFSDEFTPLLFLEDLLYSGNPQKYLSEELSARFDDLKAFIGDFSHAMPPSDYEKGVFLVCEKTGYKRFKATPFRFEVVGGIITGIQKL